MRTLYHLSVWLHVLGASLWLGGMLFLVLVMLPVTRQGEWRQMAASLVRRTGIRFRDVSWVAFAFLLLSGIFNLAYRGYTWADLFSGRLWQGGFGHTLAWKLSLFAAVLLTSALHDFVVGPRATRLWQEEPGGSSARTWRRAAAWMGRLNLLLGVLIVFLAVAMVRGGI